MKRFLSCMATAVFILTLLAEPLRALDIVEIPPEVSSSGTIIGIEEYGDTDYTGWLEFKVTVVDDATSAPIVGALVRLTNSDTNEDAGIGPAITGSKGSYATDKNGVITFRIYPTPQRYRLQVPATGVYFEFLSDTFAVKTNSRTTVRLLKDAPVPPPDTGGHDRYYDVFYYALKGGSVSLQSERVLEGWYPTKVPRPRADKGYQFVGWMQGTRMVTPAKQRIYEDTAFYAVFVPELPLIPLPIEPIEPPNPPLPHPEDPDNPFPGGTPDGGGSNGASGGGTWSGNHTGGFMSSGTRHDYWGSHAALQGGIMGGAETEDAAENQVTPAPTSPDAPEAPNTPQEKHDAAALCFLHWWILACAILTLVLMSLRLLAVRRRLRALGDDLEEEEVSV